MTSSSQSLLDLAEVHAFENGELVGIYVGDIRRAASWARRANPNASLRARASQEKRMNAPTKIDLPPVLPGWADPRTKRAYALIEELYRTFPPDCESDAASAVFHAMEAIEAADYALDGGAL